LRRAFYFAAFRLCVKTAVRKECLTQRREGAKTSKGKLKDYATGTFLAGIT